MKGAVLYSQEINFSTIFICSPLHVRAWGRSQYIVQCYPNITECQFRLDHSNLLHVTHLSEQDLNPDNNVLCSVGNRPCSDGLLSA